MKLILSLLFIFSLWACGQSNTNPANKIEPPHSLQEKSPAQTSMNNNYPSLQNAHPLAQKLMNEPWYYSPIDDMAPFGSDDAADTYAAFADWRTNNSSGNTRQFILVQIQSMGYPPINLESVDLNEIKTYILKDELGSRYLFGLDASIISTALGQLYLEGKIDNDLKSLARKAIERELQPDLINRWEGLKEIRKKRLADFLRILDSSN
jgi:uncharacterized protein YfeS